MRLFLSMTVIVCVSVLVGTCLPILLTRWSYRVFPWSVTDLLWRAFVWSCAWAMEIADRCCWWVGARALRRGWFRLDRAAMWLSAHVNPYRYHVTAVVHGKVCWPCMEGADGWWDYEVDCGGHRCGECFDCADRALARLEAKGQHLPSA